MPDATFAPGALVRARDREWVVLPESSEDMLILRPLGGGDDEVAGVYLPLENVESATFAPPAPEDLGDFRSCRLLRDAVRLGFRSSAGPFRSFGRLAVEPRPYQLVPLLMALRLDPVRLLIADDVGIGKTVEAALVARELIDRGEVQRMTVLCPPHLAEQWQRELSQKFHIEAELVLSSTAPRLEKGLRLDESLFDRHPFTVVSLDFIKTERRREDFVRRCPELVLVDEAHTCAAGGRTGQQQRHELLRRLAEDPTRHVILVTATPHSGDENAFRSLLRLLSSALASIPDDLENKDRAELRRNLARHLVQRRRPDIKRFLDEDTPFPEREETERAYEMSAEYRRLLDEALDYARETTLEAGTDRRRQRVRWWSALALLRSIGSSPAAAAATLRSRARVGEAESAEEADILGRESVMDDVEEHAADGCDATPGADLPEDDAPDLAQRRRLGEMARRFDDLRGDADAKLVEVVKIVKSLVQDGFQPIVFCRFISTAQYVAAELRGRLGAGVEVQAVTGRLPPDEREGRVEKLAKHEKRVLVATDCLSEGINLQHWFSAAVHYDLSWNPTRHEQREGRVDRYGQASPTVRVVTYYGRNNPVDGHVIRVLLRKHRAIRSALGVSVPVPIDSQDVVSALIEGLVLRGRGDKRQLELFEADVLERERAVGEAWKRAAEQEKRSRTVFAQETIGTAEVAQELEAARDAVGAGEAVRHFVEEALKAEGAIVSPDGPGIKIDLSAAPRALRDALDRERPTVRARFELPAPDDCLLLTRTHPFVEALAAHIFNAALDPNLDGPARRCGVIRTRQVERRTVLALVRFRFHIVVGRGEAARRLLAEDCVPLAFEGLPDEARPLDAGRANKLFGVLPDQNVAGALATSQLKRVLEGLPVLAPRLDAVAGELAARLLEAHRRVRHSVSGAAAASRVVPHLPPDLLGLYVFLPVLDGEGSR